MFDLILLTVLVSIPFVFVLTRPPRIISNQASFFRHRALRLAGILFLAVLASYYIAPGTPLPRSSAPRGNIPSLSLLPTALSPTPTALKGTDWPTYHHDNARTGYLANEPDPKRLIPAWTAKLDHAVSLVSASLLLPREIASTLSMLVRGRCNGVLPLGNPFPCQR